VTIIHKIMVVEDNSATRRAVCNALTRSGHSVIEAPDGKTARELMRSEHPRVVLQDLMLPDTDGFELVTQLRLIAGADVVSILAFSGFASELLESRAASVEFDDIISKPIAPSRLVPIIESHLPSSRDPVIEPFGKGKRVVLVDDDPLQLKLATFRLQRVGFTVVPALDVKAAMAAMREHAPDIVVSDVMMPEVDGFGLAMELRCDATLKHIPLVLVTSSYVEPADRELARRAGANGLIARTPELEEVFTSMRALLGTTIAPTELPSDQLLALEREHTARVVRQLERQVMLNSGLAKRCSALASELTVLTGISETILEERDFDTALDEAIAGCFDAGGIGMGALYMLGTDGRTTVRYLGAGNPSWTTADLETLFGHAEVLRAVIQDRRTITIPTGVSPEVGAELLARAHATALMLVPLAHGDKKFGGLLMAARDRSIDLDDWRAFAHGVATQIASVVSLGRAYDARTQAEKKARDHAAVLDALFASAPDLILQIDRSGVIQISNRPTVAVGTNWFATVVEADRARAALELACSTQRPTEVELQLAPNRTFAVHFSPVIDPNASWRSRVTSLVLVVRDVTDHKQAEIQLVLADRMASVGTLAAGVAHEINNPLTSVITNLDLASTEIAKLGETMVLPLDLEDELRDARHGAERVREIVRDLKIFSRAEEERSGPVDIDRVLESTLRMAWTELRHRARVVKDWKEVPQVYANESRLGQVFLNLMINAAHAIPEGNYEANEIRISTALRGDQVVVSISDTGGGIPLEVRQRLFTPFFTTKPVGVGTGLGLAISLKIVTSFGGTITFDSEVGQGTVFHVALPAIAPIELPAVSRVATKRETRRGRVLVVDDDQQLGQAIRRYLTSYHDVVVVQSGRAALTLFEAGERFDVVLCDVMMPQVTGMELFGEVQRLDPTQAERIVFLTGGAFTIAARMFLDGNTNQRLEKPFDLKTLRRIVNDMIQ